MWNRRQFLRACVAGGAVLWVADVWYSIKKHWVIEAQRVVRARREALEGARPPGG